MLSSMAFDWEPTTNRCHAAGSFKYFASNRDSLQTFALRDTQKCIKSILKIEPNTSADNYVI